MAIFMSWIGLLCLANHFAMAERPTADPGTMPSHAAQLENAVVDSSLDTAPASARAAGEAEQDTTRLAFDGRGLASFSQLSGTDRKTRQLFSRRTAGQQGSGGRGAWGKKKKETAIVVAGENGDNGGEKKKEGWWSKLKKAVTGEARKNRERERLAKLAAVTEESLATALKAKQEAAKPPKSPAEQEVNPKATWQKVLKAHEAYRTNAEPKYWKSQLKSVTADAGFGKQKGEYNDFFAKVLSMHPDHLDKVIESAHEVVDKNHEVNQKSYEYIDDLEKMANGTAQGYNKMATQQFYAYDQILSQLKEGHMAPGKAIKLLFPLSGDVRFKPNSGDLAPSSNAYFTSTFADHLKSKLKKYRGMHFTICVHTATNLQTQDVPLAFASPEDQELETQEDGQQMTVGIKKLLTNRALSLQNEIHDVMKNALGDLQVKREEYHFPTVSADMMHFDTDMPAGAVLVIAEDRLHRDDFHGTTEEEAQQHAKEVEKFDQTKCKINDFNQMKTHAQIEEQVRPLEEREPYSSLPENFHEENRETAKDKHRISPNAIVTWAEENAQLPRDQQIGNTDDLVRAYGEAKQEQAKYAQVLDKKANLENVDSPAPSVASLENLESPAPSTPSSALVVAPAPA